jgi:hypothetical protein
MVVQSRAPATNVVSTAKVPRARLHATARNAVEGAVRCSVFDRILQLPLLLDPTIAGF